MTIVNAAIIGIIAVIISIQFKSGRNEYGIYIALTACAIIFFYGLSKMSVLIDVVNRMSSYVSISSTYIAVLVKIIGITYIAEFSSDICKDSGYSAIANQIQIFGKLSVLAVSMPIVVALLDTINAFLGSGGTT